MAYRVISGDCHIDLGWLPADLFVSQAPARFRNRVPHVVESGGGLVWRAGDTDMGGVAGTSLRGRREREGVSKHVDRMIGTGLYEDADRGTFRPTTPELRIKDQEMDGVDAEVIYGIVGVGSWLRQHDPELLSVIYQIYNDWVAGFCRSNPERLKALACIPNHDPEVAAAELRRAAGLGLVGADFDVSTAARPLYHRDWDILWATAAECGMPVSFHSTGWSLRGENDPDAADYYSEIRAVRGTMFQLLGAEYLVEIIFSGACDRHPEFKFVLGECGVTWLPFALNRMDHLYEDRFHHLNFSMNPSRFWRRQGYSTFQEDHSAGELAGLIGEDNMIWGSDYPHRDGVWPDSQRVIQNDLARVEDRVRRKIICENAGKLYGFIK